ncbi:succinate--CoA ligase [GDP-forming] subunit beta, mitochondrial-like [Ruditapes philippinarum]|uniref:succinate--CoA ligase [GDP-forming] subunit beta, mitochondrial-like n=1 Tax=Ruditapes philippinarum TaxID=129788 RepID=UPI00295BD9D2|nr:succinate--CoA ligase [GDP-forming] subunit beta, mitochondrial-like [Ruditapes philippinarum]
MAAPLSSLRHGLSRKFLRSAQKTRVLSSCLQKRWLHLQEYQSKTLMKDHDIEVQHFEVVDNADAAKSVPSRLNASEYVIKAQILAGGRGKGTFSNGFKGGVQLTKDPSKVSELVSNMVGHKLVTKQTHGDGVLVQKVMVAEALDIARETYFAILLDRQYNGPVIVGSSQGGVDIEEVAVKTPEAIFHEPVDIMEGLSKETADKIAEKLGFKGKQHALASDQVLKLYKMFIDVDATQIEINPFVETPDGRVVCFDAKMNFDDNAEYRQKEIFDMDDLSEMDPREVEATEHHLNYIGLEGNIGCLVNGAGLAMATMDIIKLFGGEPANFLDVGGGVTEQQVYNAFHILTADAHVKAILINVFGGIVNCETMANGIIKAYTEAHMTVPMVVRLEGQNAASALQILKDSGLDITTASDMADAAQKVVSLLPKS